MTSKNWRFLLCQKNNYFSSLFYLLLVLSFLSCHTDSCSEGLMWRNKNLRSISFKPKQVFITDKKYCGYDFSLKQWSPLPMAVRIDNDFLKGEVFQIKDTLFLKSSIGKISPFILWDTIIPTEYSVKTTVISRYIEDNFKEGRPNDFDFIFSRDTLFSHNSDTIQRLRIKNFNRYNGASLVMVINKKYGIEGVYISMGKAEEDSHELIFTLEGNIYWQTIPNALMFDPKHMSLE